MEKKNAIRVILLSILVSYMVCEGKIYFYNNYLRIIQALTAPANV